MSEPSTPLMRQYAAVKKEHPNALLFFRLGDFYELFFEDAVVAVARAANHADLAQQGKRHRHTNVRRALSLRRKLHCQAHSQGIQGRHLRADGRPARSQEAGEARGHARADAGHRGRRASRIGGKQLSGAAWCAPGTPWDLPRSISRPANFAPPNSRATTPNAACARSCWCCVRARCCSRRRCRCSISHARAHRPRHAASAPRIASLENASWAETPLEDWVFSPDYAIPAGRKSFRCAVAGGLWAGKPFGGGHRGGRDPALRSHHAARIARSRGPHRLLRAAELPGAGRRHRPQSRADRTAVFRRRRRRNAVSLPRLHGDADGQAPAARLDAATVHRRSPKSSSASMPLRAWCRTWSGAKNCAARWKAFSIWSAC